MKSRIAAIGVLLAAPAFAQSPTFDNLTVRGAITGDVSGALVTPTGGTQQTIGNALGGSALKANNLSDLTDALTARSNLGLGSLATQNTIAGTDASGGTVTATGTVAARTTADRAADIINVKDGYGGQPGAKGDGKIASPVVTLSGTALTVGASTFAATDVGKTIVVAGAGTAPISGPVMTVPVATAGSGYATLPTCAVTDGAGTGADAACAALMSIGSATLSTAGTTCTNGTQTFIVGIDATGTPAQFTGVVAGGVLTGALTVTVPGLMTDMGAVSAVPAYGANCATPPTVALSYGVAAIQVTALGATYSTAQTTAALTGGTPSVAATLGAPLIGAPVPPLVTTISGYTSPTQVTLAAAATTAITSTATKILWATDDSLAFQKAINAGHGIWIPAGLYWIGATLDPGSASLSVRGEGSANSILAWDNGTSVSQDSGNWVPLFKSITGGTKGDLTFEDFQIRGLLDFGRVNTGASSMELNFFNALRYDRMKWYQISWMAQQNEIAASYSVTNSIFDTVMRDAARCRSCYNAIVRNNKFIHSDDDSVALHQASFLNGPGLVREGIVVEGNTFEDTTGIHIIGARNISVAHNILRRSKVNSITVSSDSAEGIDQIQAINISDNIITDSITRVPFTSTAATIGVAVSPPKPATGLTQFIPGANMLGTTWFGKPWDYSFANVVSGTGAGPAARGINIHDNHIMRTLPASSSYSAWGFGRLLSNAGFIDPPMADPGMVPVAGISVSVNAGSLQVHNNDIQNVRRGIGMNDNIANPSQTSLAINSNHIFDAWEYGIVSFGSGTPRRFDIMGNDIDVDPYGVSPGRANGHGGWSASYAASRCITITNNAVINMSDNTFSDCYAIQSNNTWVVHNNIVRGTVASGTTGQPNVYSTVNFGVGQFPLMAGDRFFLSSVAADPTATAPANFGTLSNTHITLSAAAPTTGYHVINDMIWSTDPVGCSCSGWSALTTGTAWVLNTDYKVQP